MNLSGHGQNKGYTQMTVACACTRKIGQETHPIDLGVGISLYVSDLNIGSTCAVMFPSAANLSGQFGNGFCDHNGCCAA